MCEDKVIRRFAGVMVLVSGVLVWQVSPWWLLFTAFIGVNLIQSTYTKYCPAERLFARVGLFGCRPATWNQ